MTWLKLTLSDFWTDIWTSWAFWIIGLDTYLDLSRTELWLKPNRFEVDLFGHLSGTRLVTDLCDSQSGLRFEPSLNCDLTSNWLLETFRTIWAVLAWPWLNHDWIDCLRSAESCGHVLSATPSLNHWFATPWDLDRTNDLVESWLLEPVWLACLLKTHDWFGLELTFESAAWIRFGHTCGHWLHTSIGRSLFGLTSDDTWKRRLTISNDLRFGLTSGYLLSRSGLPFDEMPSLKHWTDFRPSCLHTLVDVTWRLRSEQPVWLDIWVLDALRLSLELTFGLWSSFKLRFVVQPWRHMN